MSRFLLRKSGTSLLVIAPLMLLTACSTPPTRQQMGIATGAVVGGVVGAVVTGGSSVGTVAGAAAGGVVGAEIARNTAPSRR